MRDLQTVRTLFANIPNVEVVDIESGGTGTEVSIRRGGITAKFFVPTEGTEADIVRLLADGGQGTGGGEGRKLVDDAMIALDGGGISGLRVVDGSKFWDKQPDFQRREGGVKITHLKKW